MSAENKELIRRVADEIFSQGRVEAIDRYYASDWVLHDAPPNAGANREGLKKVLQTVREGFPDVHSRIDIMLAEGDLVASRVISEGTHTREYFGMAPMGKTVRLVQIGIDRVRDGKIVESWYESFGQGFHYQLTGKPAPVEAAAR